MIKTIVAILTTLCSLWPSTVSALNISEIGEVVANSSTLDIRFNPSGTHVDNHGNLKIRLDFYPGPEDKSYAMQHVEVVDETSAEFQAGYKGELDKDGNPVDLIDYQKWLDALPKVWVTNPTLCHFLTVKQDITKAELDAIVKSLFTGDVTATIDDAAIQANSAHLLSPYMRDKTTTTLTRVAPTEDKVSLVDAVNARLDGFVVDGNDDSGQGQLVAPQSIDVGPGATDRASTNISGFTLLALGNPANATGTLDTFELWAATNGLGYKMGTFSGSGTSWDDRDYESLGAVTGGSKTTLTGLTCGVETNDVIGVYYGSGSFERDDSGGSGCAVSGDKFGAGVTTYSANSRIYSLYATGLEAGGGWVNIGKANGVGEASLGKINDVAKAAIGRLNGVTP